jgi:hypothetical protein
LTNLLGPDGICYPVRNICITNHLSNDLSGVEEKRENYWRWPNSIGDFGVYHLTEMTVVDDALKSGKIVHLKLIFHNANAWICRARRTFFPSMDSKRTVGCEVLIPAGLFPNPARVGCVEGELASYRKDVDSSRQKPGDEEDAYASGRPGDGGNGGKVISYLATAPVDLQSCDVSEGVGSTPESISGGKPGTPTLAYWAEMYAIQWDAVAQASLNPSITLTDVSSKKGADAPGKTSNNGKKGSVQNQQNKTALWVHPEAARTVITYAQDTCRNGHRDKARTLLNPYYYRLTYHQEDLSGELVGSLTDIVSLLTNMDNNLDYYGKPPVGCLG